MTKDVVSIEYFENPERFADLLNTYVYEGKQIVRGEDVKELNRSFSRVVKGKKNVKTQVVTADVVKEVNGGMRPNGEMKATVVSLENQALVHYAMPIRVMNLEACGYHEQWRQKDNENRKAGRNKMTESEFLSGVTSKQRFTPMITLVLYFGKEPWNGPKCLWELLDLEGYSEQEKKLVADYPINVIDVRRYENSDLFRTDLKLIFGVLKRENSKKELAEFLQENQKEFEAIKTDAYNMISVMVGCDELLEAEEKNRTGGENNMCKAIYDMVEDGRLGGRQEGKQKM